jgi:hypothetical protein
VNHAKNAIGFVEHVMEEQILVINAWQIELSLQYACVLMELMIQETKLRFVQIVNGDA